MILALSTVSLVALAGFATWGMRSPVEPDRNERPLPKPTGSRFAPADPLDVNAWLRRIDQLRVEDRPIDASAVGWAAYSAVSPQDRIAVVRALTLALLTDVPEEQATEALQARIAANPDDLDARAARIRRALNATSPPPAHRSRSGPRRDSSTELLEELRRLLDRAPSHLGVRAALVEALLDAGRIDEARSILAEWPETAREDPRWRDLRARFDLDIDGQPGRAVEALARLLEELPQDWPLRARYSRALEMAGDPEAARMQAALVDRLRERLDPERLGPFLVRSLEQLDDPARLADLGNLCASVGLTDLAAAWRREAAQAIASPDRAESDPADGVGGSRRPPSGR